jgi:branched-chain amino acid transport system permease protein
VVTILWSGFSTGAVYVLAALGYNIVFVTAGVFNFSQAQFIMVGTFVAYATSAQLHLPIALGFLFGAAVCFAIGAIEERIALRPIAGRGAHGELITTVGIAVVMDGIAELIWGSQPRVVPFLGSSRSLVILGGRLLLDQILLVVAAVVLTFVLLAWSRWTLTGLACLAASEDRRAAMLRGVNVRRFTFLAVAVAAALAGLVGPLVGPATFAVYNIGDILVAFAFLSLALGGFGSYLGALIGGLGVGVAQAFAQYYFDTNQSDLLMFALLLLILLVRPRGLLGKKSMRIV